MLPRRYRLRVQELSGKRFARETRAKCFTVKYFPSARFYPRFGVVIGKRVARTAVMRNRIKRRIFAAVQKEVARFPNHDIIIFPTQDAVSLPSSQFRDSLFDVLSFKKS